MKDVEDVWGRKNARYCFTTIIEHATDKAVLIKDSGDGIWLPLSMIKISKSGNEAETVYMNELVEIDMPEWLAKRKGLL